MTYFILIKRSTGNQLGLKGEVSAIFQYKEDNDKLFYVFSRGAQEILESLFQQETQHMLKKFLTLRQMKHREMDYMEYTSLRGLKNWVR